MAPADDRPLSRTTAEAGADPQPQKEPIAVIGMACRFPGAATPEAFWRLLRDGVDALSDVPADRFDVDALYDPRPGVPGKLCCRRGGFVADVDRFDAAFFGISRREAAAMDPQHRLLLEVAWECLEDAGLRPGARQRADVGCFVGICSDDEKRAAAPDLDALDLYRETGVSHGVAAGRVANACGLGGPSLAVDSDRSASLVAVHLACQSLWSGDCSAAIATGVHLILGAETSVALSRAGLLAADGRTKAFAAGADGLVRGEGAGAVALKPLGLALRDGDRVRALIRGSAVNNDGGGALVRPRRGAQVEVVRRALRHAGVAAGRVDYVEAHGTGTPVGDAVEAAALGEVFAAVGRRRRCAVGSVKTNIGHAEAAAGIAGLIKVVLCLERRMIPPSLHCRQPNPGIPWRRLRLAVQRRLTPWPGDRPGCAGVSSFGIAGTNAHVVLEEAPAARREASAEGRLHLLPLSARSPRALCDLARAWADFLASEPAPDVADACYTAAVRRCHHRHRLVVAGRSRRRLIAGLEVAAANPAEVPPPAVAGGAEDAAAQTLASRWLAGEEVSWDGLYDVAGRCISLPPYPWQRRRFPLTARGREANERPAPGAGTGDARARRSSEPSAARHLTAVLGLSRRQLDPSASLIELGLDSLMATELVHRLGRDLGIEVSAAAVLAARDLRQLDELLGRAGAEAPREPAAAGGARDDAPLSHGQQALWLLQRMVPESSAYHLAFALRIFSPLDTVALRRALVALGRRHPVLRTVFRAGGDGPRQRVLESSEIELRCEEATGWNAARLGARLEREAWAPFDLESGPPVRALVLSAGPEDHALLVTLHHILADFWSAAILFRELGMLYAEHSGGPAAALEPLADSYGEIARRQRRRLTGAGGERLWRFWRRQLTDLPAGLDLAADRPRPRLASQRGGSRSRLLDAGTSAGLRRLARARGVTFYTVLLAAFQALLGRLTGRRDLLVGSPMAGRGEPGSAAVVGPFANLVPLRADLSADPTFQVLLERTRRTVLAAVEHQDLPFALLVERLRPRRDASRAPLVQAMFALEQAPRGGEQALAACLVGHAGERWRLGPLAVESLALERRGAQLDVTVVAAEIGDRLATSIEYAADLFDAATASRLLRHYLTLLSGVAATPERRLCDLPLLTSAERHALLVEPRPPLGGGPRVRRSTVPELIACRARRSPHAVAVCAGRRALSYRQLVLRADRLAGALRRSGVGPETVVGLCLEPSVEAVIALLGILKSGGAFLYLDPEHPERRLALMARDAGVEVIVTRSGLAPACRCLPGRRLWLETPLRDAGDAPAPRIRGLSLAYVVYTSGSTGRPKAVGVSHGEAAAHLSAAAEHYRLAPSDRVLQLARWSVDVALEQILAPLIRGAALVLRHDAEWGPASFAARCRRLRLTTVNVPAVYWRRLAAEWASDAAEPGPELRRVIVGGETFPPASLRRPRPWRFRLLNAYGPTEATITATAFEVPRRWHRQPPPRVPVGRAVGGRVVRVLDAGGRPLPAGAAGEVCLGGAGLARGYLRRPGRTARSFVPDPYGGRPGARLYRTGDLGRGRQDGALELLGRRDLQTKIRGFRVEPGEIQAALEAHPQIRQAVVVARRDGALERRLVAYVVTRGDGKAAGGRRWRRFLRRRLPEHMVPAAFVALPELPATAAGKVDLRALPAPSRERGLPAQPPDGATERVIAAVWRAVLGVDRIGVNDNFFDAGGHSLLLFEVQSRLRRRLGRAIPMVELFAHPTIRALADHLRDAGGAEPVADRPAAPAAGREAIAIVGMSGRFPGSPDLDAFWRGLRDGAFAVSSFSQRQLLAAGVAPQEVRDPRYVPARGVLDGAELFDAGFFGFSPRQAETTDPQHRVFLECAWEALEDAGVDPERGTGPIGVFAGLGLNDYALSRLASGDAEPLSAAIGNDKDFLATRVSYALNLRGPSLSVQTACSTSLVAVHLACQSLLSGDSELALAGGVAIALPQTSGYLHRRGGILSPDGRCRAFDAAAGGTVLGNGVGIVVLKRLSGALADGDRVRAVILGSAINNDGSRKVGYTAPGVEGQTEVIRAAHAAAGIDATTISYVEAHGTGTRLGDPVEVAALKRAFAAGDVPAGICALGSVKTNIGHLDAAAGVAGLIKTVLALEHRVLPPSLHFERPNPELELAAGPFYVNAERRPWPRAETPRRAGVSSFGIGGTNAHVVLEEAPETAPGEPSASPHLLVLSARSAPALEAVTDRLADHLRRHRDLDAGDVAHTLRVGRRCFEHRRAVVARDLADAAGALAARDPRRVIDGVAVNGAVPVIFMFPGQGAQHADMGRELYRRQPVFRRWIDRCGELLRPHLELDLCRLLYPPPLRRAEAAERLRRTSLAQPALFAVELALARLWMDQGVRPRAMIGHSLGEYTAACLAGALSLEDALSLVALRGRLMEQTPAGAMLAVSLGADELAPRLGDRLELAAINAPSRCVVSGPAAAVAALAEELAAAGVGHRRLAVSRAFHSRAMDGILEPFAAAVRDVELRPARLPYLSNLTGDWIGTPEPDDWVRHLRQPVDFAAGITRALEIRNAAFLEVGPESGLGPLVRQIAGRGDRRLILPSLTPAAAGGDAERWLSSLGRLWTAGVELEAGAAAAGRRRVSLPTYPFERRRYWRSPRPPSAHGERRRREGPGLYAPGGRRLPAPSAGAAGEPGAWLLLMPEGGPGRRLAEVLAAAGSRVSVAYPGDGFARLGAGRYALRPGARRDVRALLAELERHHGEVPATVVHLWTAIDPDSAADRSSDLRLGLDSLLALAGAWDRRRRLRLCVVTTGACEVTGDERLVPERAASLGPVRVWPQESTRVVCQAIDVAAGMTGDDLSRRLLAELGVAAPEPVVALRGGHRWLQSVEPLCLDAARGAERLRDGGVYLVTGGLGGLGLALTEQLARRLRATWVLLGRSRFPDADDWPRRIGDGGEPGDEPGTGAKIRRLQALRDRGVDVAVVRADVTDLEAMRTAVAGVEARFGPIHGVLHAAGTVAAGDLRTKTPAGVAAVLAPKVDGTRVLESVFADSARQPLDFLVLFSSTSALLGGRGLADYAAANAWLEAFAQRRARGRTARTLAVSWGPWDAGMGAAAAAGSRLVKRRLDQAITPADGCDALLQALGSELPQVIVSPTDLAVEIDKSRRAVARDEPPAEPAEPAAGHPRPPLPAAYVAPRDEAERRIAAIWCELLGLEQVGVDDSFLELGGDSLLAIQFLARLRRETGQEVSLEAFFETLTVAELARATAGEAAVAARPPDDLEDGEL